MTAVFVTPLTGATPDRLAAAIDALTDEQMDALELGFIDVAQIEISEWWAPMLGLHDDVDVADLFCRLYQRMIAKTEGA